MIVFRIEVLLDAVFASVAILLVLLLMVRPATTGTDHFRQATVAVGCFAEGDGEPWSGRYSVYRRIAAGGEGPSTEPVPWSIVASDSAPRALRRALKAAIAPDGGFTRLVLMVDFAGSACADDGTRAGATLAATLGSMNELPEFEGWNFRRELVPCADRTGCERLLRLPLAPERKG